MPMNSFFSRLKNFVTLHKKWSAFIVFMLVFGAYYTHKHATTAIAATHYVVTQVQDGTVVASVTGSGQVSASNQINLDAKAAGTISSLPVTTGSHVNEGGLIAQIYSEDTDINLQSAQIAYQKFVEPPTAADVTADKNAVTTSYSNAWSSVSNTFSNLPTVIAGLKDLFYNSDGYLSDQNMSTSEQDQTAIFDRNAAGADFDSAQRLYTNVLAEYTSLSPQSDPASLKTLVSDTYHMTLQLAVALKDAGNTLTYIATHNSAYNPKGEVTAATNVAGWVSTTDSDSSSLLSAQNSVTQSENTLSTLETGPDPLDVQSQKLTLQQKQEAYNDTFITAPFDGTVASLSIHKGDTVSSGTTIGTFITNDKIADITLNEVDVAKVKEGDKATLTFDALSGLSISGTVASIDLVGAVSQGVVSYDVKVAFDTEDPRVESGMTVSAAIQTDIASNVIVIPASAIKTTNGQSFVQVVNENLPPADLGNPAGITLTNAPQNKPVTVGITDDTNTEIVSGLNVGDEIVTKTVAGTGVKTATPAAPSLLGGAGARGGAAGGAVPVRRGFGG